MDVMRLRQLDNRVRGCFASVFLGALHVGWLVLALFVPVMLFLQSIRVDGRFSFAKWSAILLDSGTLLRWLDLLRNSALIGITAVGIALVVGIVLGFLAFRMEGAAKSALMFLVILWLCIPTYVMATAVMTTLGIRLFLEITFTAVVTAGVVQGLVSIPWTALLVGLGFRSVEPELEEAALLDTSTWGMFRHVTLPRSSWSISATAMILFLWAITDYTITDLLNIRCFAEEIFTQYAHYGERVTPFVVSLPIGLLALGGLWALHRLGGRWANPLSTGWSASRARRISSGRWGTVFSWTVSLIVAGALVVSLWWIVKHLLPVGESLCSWRLWRDWIAIRPDWITSVLVAVLTAMVLGGLSVGLAWMFGKSRWGRWWVGAAILGLMAVPAPTLAMSLLSLFNTASPTWWVEAWTNIGFSEDPVSWFRDSVWMYVLTLGLKWTPLAVLMMLPAVRRIPREWDELLSLDGARWWDRLRSVYWPQCRRSAGLVGLVVLIVSMAELNCTYLISIPGEQTLSIRFFSFVHNGLSAELAAVALAALLTAVVPAIVLFLALRSPTDSASSSSCSVV